MFHLTIPPTHHFTNLNELEQFLEGAEGGENLVTVHGHTEQLSVNDQGEILWLNGSPEPKRLARLTPRGIKNICNHLSIPFTTYLSTINSATHSALDVTERAREKSRELGKCAIRVDKREDVILGITTEKYAFYPNANLIRDLRNAVEKAQGVGELAEDVMFQQARVQAGCLRAHLLSNVRLVQPRLGDNFQIGLLIENAHDRTTSVKVSPFALQNSINRHGEMEVGIVMTVGVRIIHRGTRFDERLAEGIAKASEMFDAMTRALVNVGAIQNVDRKTWDNLLEYVAKRGLGKRRIREIFDGVEEANLASEFFFVVEKKSVEGDGEIIEVKTEGKTEFPMLYRKPEEIPALPRTLLVCRTTDFVSAQGVVLGDNPETGKREIVKWGKGIKTISKDLRERLRTHEKETRVRDPYQLLQAFLTEATTKADHDDRLDWERAAGDVLKSFTDGE